MVQAWNAQDLLDIVNFVKRMKEERCLFKKGDTCKHIVPFLFQESNNDMLFGDGNILGRHIQWLLLVVCLDLERSHVQNTHNQRHEE